MNLLSVLTTSFSCILLLLVTLSLCNATPLLTHAVQQTFDGQATFFYPGLGSCGWRDNATSMIVAMNAVQGNGFCGRHVRITNEQTSRTAVGRVTDLCESCGKGDLDLSPALFHALGGTDAEGVFPIHWDFA